MTTLKNFLTENNDKFNLKVNNNKEYVIFGEVDRKSLLDNYTCEDIIIKNIDTIGFHTVVEIECDNFFEECLASEFIEY